VAGRGREGEKKRRRGTGKVCAGQEWLANRERK